MFKNGRDVLAVRETRQLPSYAKVCVLMSSVYIISIVLERRDRA